jgi:DNA-binding NarL/FixJ family response regulator
MTIKKQIIITDDHPLLIEGLSAVINEDKALNVCATASTGKQLLQIIPLQKPDLIMLDINLPGMDGIETAKVIKAKHPDIDVLCISSYFSQSLITTLKAIPVEGFIPKQTDSRAVVKTIKQILAGETVFIKSEVENPYGKPEVKELKLLTEREKEVIQLIKKGKTTKEIADMLFLSVYTIDTHRKNICAKLNVSNPGALSRFATEKEI